MAKKVANQPAQDTGTSKGRTSLAFKKGFTHAAQHKGDSSGSGGWHRTPLMNHGGESYVFRAPPPKNSHVFEGTKKSGHLYVSGDSRAHQVGKKK